MELNRIDIAGINERVNDIRGALNIAAKATRAEFDKIINSCSNNTFKFTAEQSEGWDYLVGKQYTHNSETDVPIKEVTCSDDCIVLIDYDDNQYFPYELDLSLFDIVCAMTAKLVASLVYEDKD
jgi:hypothetical protein